MEKIEINKIKKNRTYTYEEIKEMFEDAAAKTCVNPFGDIEKLDKKTKSRYGSLCNAFGCHYYTYTRRQSI